MFSGQLSLNVRTATIGGNVPIQHYTWPEPQPYANLQSHRGRYTVFYTVTPQSLGTNDCGLCFREETL